MEGNIGTRNDDIIRLEEVADTISLDRIREKERLNFARLKKIKINLWI